jgi:hypothetical protein
MKFTFAINQARYRDGLNTFVHELNADALLLLKEEMRLLLRDIIRFTPPKNLKQGRSAVEADIQKAVGLLDQDSFARAREEVRLPMRELIRRKDNETLQQAMRDMDGRNWIVKPFNKQDHISRRNRYGRVRQKSFIMTTDRIAYRKYVREVQRRVGLAKAGWLRAAEGVGLKLPSWVKRHAGYAKGGYTEPTPNRMEIVARNGSIKIPNYQQRIVQVALNARRMSIEKEIKRLASGGKTRRASFAGTVFGQSSP